MELITRTRTLWARRGVVATLVTRDLRVRYSRSVLGYLWTVLDPLLMALIYFVVFVYIFNRDDLGHSPYFLFLLVGLLSWQWFSASLTDTSRALISEAKLVRSTNLPREIWVLRVVLSKGVEYFLSLPVLVGFLLIYLVRGETHLNAWLVLFPVGIVVQFIALVGLGLHPRSGHRARHRHAARHPHRAADALLCHACHLHDTSRAGAVRQGALAQPDDGHPRADARRLLQPRPVPDRLGCCRGLDGDVRDSPARRRHGVPSPRACRPQGGLMVPEPVISVDGLGIEFYRSRRRRLQLREMLFRGRTSAPSEMFWALRDVTFDISPGEAVGIVGGNGSGKSTLLKMIAGVLIPDEGEVTVRQGVAPLIELTGGFVGELDRPGQHLPHGRAARGAQVGDRPSLRRDRRLRGVAGP